MNRLALFGSWKRLGVQAGLLAGLGLAFVGGSEKPAQAGGDCVGDEACSFKKPNLLIVLDYSSSMNDDFQPGQTRWEAAVEAIENVVTQDNGFFDESMHLGLMRFGHDPDPENDGTIITVSGQTDPSGITDGQALDVGWYDQDNDPTGYFECNGENIVDFLTNVEPPLCIGLNCAGIGTWTQGALQAARDYIGQTRIDHPEDVVVDDERAYFVMLMTDGVWTTQVGQAPINAVEQAAADPVPVGGDLFSTDDVPVYVVAFGDAIGESFGDDLANAGGTVQAIDAAAGQLVPALETVIDDIEDTIIIPECTGGLPRIMVILDASSSMLNTGNPLDPDTYASGAMGMTGWDQAREALSGGSSIFDVLVPGVNNQPVEDLVHLGLIAFGTEDDEQLLVDYGPCMEDNFGWALDPNTTCGAGCADPWGGPPIIWTAQGPGSAGYPDPPFDQDTYSVMPDCNTGMFDLDACTGSATATHTGLALANSNAETYRLTPPDLYPVDASTQFFNILITDGAYSLNGWSTDEQVSAELTDMVTNDNTTTFVIGFGDDEQLAPTELGNMACWGSGGTGIPCTGGTIDFFTAANQTELEDALGTIIEQINFDPCCGFNDCSFNPEPTTGEPDPEPVDSSTGPDTDTEGSTGPALTSGGATSTGPASTGPGSTTDDSADSSSGGSESSTSVDPTNPTTDPTNVTGDETAGDESSGGDTAGALDDDGCGCSAGNDKGSGWLGGMFMLGLFGLVRRRK